MLKIVKMLEDVYPHGCKGDVVGLDEDAQVDLKKVSAKRDGRTLFEEVKDVVKEVADKVEEEVKLTADNLEAFVKSHKRGELNDLATAAGVEKPEELPNATKVAKAIVAKTDA